MTKIIEITLSSSYHQSSVLFFADMTYPFVHQSCLKATVCFIYDEQRPFAIKRCGPRGQQQQQV